MGETPTDQRSGEARASRHSQLAIVSDDDEEEEEKEKEEEKEEII